MAMPESKNKVLHLVEAFGGGVFTFLVELANSTCDEFDVVIAYARRKQTPENFEEYFDKRIKFIEVKNFTRSIGVKDIKACKEVRQIIKQENPDIVHMHSSKAGIVGRLVISSKNRKLFYTPHGYSFLKQDDSKLKRFIYKSIEKAAAMWRRKCKIVACSEGEYKESLKITKNSTYVNNGVNVKEIDKLLTSKPKQEVNTKDLKVCTVGRIGFQKNPELFNQIAESFPNVHFAWIGDGELNDKLTSKNIELTGWAERKTVLNRVNEADIFILPSLWEGLPIALLEAMYLKKVCIVSNVIGNRDVIHNEQNGFVCNDLEDYKKVIEEILNNKYNLTEIANKANEDILNEYNIENMSKKYIELYK